MDLTHGLSRNTARLRFIQNDLATWSVRNLLLVPRFAFPPSAIIKRKPLSATARRHGWVGCNFNLSRIPVEARIFIVRTERSMAVRVAQTFLSAGSGDFPVARLKHRTGMSDEPAGSKACPTIIIPPEKVREKFRRVKPLKEISVKERGWTLDVLNIVRRISDRSSEREFAHSKSQSRLTSAATFATSEVYAFTRELEKLHPENRHVRDKIRQQLQVLRDMGLLLHIGRSVWRLP